MPLKKDLQNISTDEQPINYTRKYRFAYIAAAIMIVAVLLQQFLKEEPTTQDLFAAYFQPYPIHVDSLKTINHNIGYDKAISAYKSKDYNTASLALAKLFRNDSMASTAFYAGMSHLAIGNDEEGFQLLDIARSKSTKYLPHMRWYNALFALKINDKRSAINHLTELQDLKSDFKKNATRRLLDHLKP